MIDMILVQVLVLSLIGGTTSSLPLKKHNNVCCPSWRLGVETNNIRGWYTIPTECVDYVKFYMEVAQYTMDLRLVVENIVDYAVNAAPHPATSSSDNRKDAWILDVDDTCISNLQYYAEQKLYGALPYNSTGFKEWALKEASKAIPDVLRLFRKLKRLGFYVILLTGRDDETFRNATIRNLRSQGYGGYDSLILRNATFKGQSAVIYKSAIRKKLEEEDGCRIVGNVGDQWTDLIGEHPGSRTFKIPNTMYFVP